MQSTPKLWLAIGVLTTGFTLNVVGAVTFTNLYSFGHNTNLNGSYPTTELTRGADGSLYGVTSQGGTNGHGTVFRITTNGLLSTLHHFNGTNGDYPSARLLRATDGNFYGVTQYGGDYGFGTVFRVGTNGSFTSLISFDNDGLTGIWPVGGLIQASDGRLYGTTTLGGAISTNNAYGYGAVFRMNTNGGSFFTLVYFYGTNGSNPETALMQALDGNLYGTTAGGGTNGYGTIFKTTSGGGLATLGSFAYTNGQSPRGALVQRGDGNLYGTTASGGVGGNGTIFRTTTTGGITNLFTFYSTNANGYYPVGTMVLGAEDVLYGTTFFGGTNGTGTGFSLTTNGLFSSVSFGSAPAPAQPNGLILNNTDNLLYGTSGSGGTNGYGTVFKSTTNGEVTVLFSFENSYATDGAYPQKLIQGAGGSLYGVTTEGGGYGQGIVFAMTTNGVRTLLHSFQETSWPYPNGLVQGKDGNLYGITGGGGTNGNGSIFRLTTNGVFTNLYSFSSFSMTNGYRPSTLLQGIDGNFYGTTSEGGSNFSGTVFKLTPAGVLTTLHSFESFKDGRDPITLVQRNDGTLYGTTYSGGTNGYGTVFKVTPSGSLTTLVSFDYMTNGAYPGLVLGADGNFYGATAQGGTNFQGTLFKMTPAGILTTLYSFSSSDGRYTSSLVQGSDGYLYGTTEAGGTNDAGTIFRIKPTGEFTTLYWFQGSEDGGAPNCLVLGKDHNYYGATYHGGSEGSGTFFRLGVPANPSIVSQPSSRTNLVGTTATFTVQAEGVLPLTYHWRKNSLNLNNGGHISGATSNVLTLANVTAADAGTYSVVVSNTFGFVVSSNALLTIPPTLPEALDASNLVWTTAGDAIWYGQIGATHDGVDAGQSGVIIDAESSWVETMVTGPATLSFWWKVSSESGYDFLIFSVNGVPQTAISGEIDWQLQGFNLGAGSQTLRWTYVKDFSVSLGQDSGWLDQVSLTLPSSAPAFQTVVKTGGTLTMTWSSIIGRLYQLQYATNLSQQSWSDLGAPVTATNITMSASTPIGPAPRCFYRLALLP